MQIPKLAAVATLALTLATGAAAEGFKLYPGATKYSPPDTPATRRFAEALRPGLTITAYLTSDPYEKVVDFYKKLGKEFARPGAPPLRKLPDGRQMRKTFLILDGVTDIGASKRWISVQRPFVGAPTVAGGAPDVRDVTEIVLTEKKDAPKEKK
jgi:hypothetical protein